MLFKLKASENNCKIQQTKFHLKNYIRNLQELVRKKVHHKCEETDGTVDWFSGEIKRITTQKRDLTKTVFTIVYDICQSEEYQFPLLMEIKKND